MCLFNAAWNLGCWDQPQCIHSPSLSALSAFMKSLWSYKRFSFWFLYRNYLFLNCRIWMGLASNQLTWLLTRIQGQRLQWATLARSSCLASTESPCPIQTVTTRSVGSLNIVCSGPCWRGAQGGPMWIEWQLLSTWAKGQCSRLNAQMLYYAPCTKPPFFSSSPSLRANVPVSIWKLSFLLDIEAHVLKFWIYVL